MIALHRPRNPIGWLLIAYGLGHAFTGLSIGLAVEGLRLGWSPESLHALTTVGRHTWILGSSTAFVLVFFLFPDGRLPDRRWRWALVAQLLSSPLDFAIWARDDWGLFRGTPAQPSYLPVPDGWMPALRDIETAKACLVLAAVFAVMFLRYRRGAEQDRRRLLWLIAECCRWR